jgi:hypothetical protein
MLGGPARALPALAFALLGLGSAQAREPGKGHYVDTDRGFRLHVGPAWTPAPPAETSAASGAILVWAHERTGQLLVVSRMTGLTDGAYAQDPAYLALVEEGVKSRSPGYRRVSLRPLFLPSGKDRVPALDLVFRMQREGKAVVMATRFLFFKNYALTLTVDAPGGQLDPSTRRILHSFRPAAQ